MKEDNQKLEGSGTDVNISMTMSVVARKKGGAALFHLTLISQRPYELAIQEALGIGQNLLRNDRHVQWVDIYEGEVALDASENHIAMLTKDDLSAEDNESVVSSSQHRPTWFSFFAYWFRWVLSRSKW